MKFLVISFFLVALLLTIVPHVAYLIARAVGSVTDTHVRYRPFAIANIIAVALWALVIAYGYYFGRFRHEVRQVEMEFDNLPPAFDGIRLVHISDIHLDSWTGHEAVLDTIVSHINSLNPDIICFTGDLVSIKAEELQRFRHILTRLHTRPGGYGIFSILGNHDYMPYAYKDNPRQRSADRRQLVAFEQDTLGWHLLMNNRAVLRRGNDHITIIGCENQSVGFHSVIRRGNLRKAMGDNPGTFSILLTHDPTQWRKEVVGKTAIPLTLAGHTHAMQFRICGITPVKLVYPECDGLYTEGPQRLYVNIGLGGTMPWRVGATPEITLITLRRKTP